MYTVITKDYCPWCTKACDLINDKGHKYNTVEISTREGFPSAMLTLVKKAGFTTVPQVFAPDGTYIGGYDSLVEYFKELE